MLPRMPHRHCACLLCVALLDQAGRCPLGLIGGGLKGGVQGALCLSTTLVGCTYPRSHVSAPKLCKRQQALL